MSIMPPFHLINVKTMKGFETERCVLVIEAEAFMVKFIGDYEVRERDS